MCKQVSTRSMYVKAVYMKKGERKRSKSRVGWLIRQKGSRYGLADQRQKKGNEKVWQKNFWGGVYERNEAHKRHQQHPVQSCITWKLKPSQTPCQCWQNIQGCQLGFRKIKSNQQSTWENENKWSLKSVNPQSWKVYVSVFQHEQHVKSALDDLAW